MGRAPCCDKEGLKKGPWTPEEDKILVDYVQTHGHGIWRSLPKQAGLLRCGKSCRLRWINYLRPDIKRGPFTPEEQKSIVQLHGIVGNKWSAIAAQVPGRTDNEIKNYWNTHLKKRLLRLGITTEANAPSSPSSVGSDGDGGTPVSAKATPFSTATRHMAQWESARLEAEARLARESLLASCLSYAATAASPGHADPSAPADAEPDIFLRMWHSEVGEAFRSKDSGSVASTGASPTSSSTKRGAAPESTEKEEERDGRAGSTAAKQEEGGCKSPVSERGAEAADSSSSNETGDGRSDETYQMYLSLVGDDMALGGLFQESLCGFSWLGAEFGEESPLDTAFK